MRCALALALSLVTLAARAESGILNIHLEPGAAVALGKPQSDYYGMGLSAGLRLDLKIIGPLAIQLAGEGVWLSSKSALAWGTGYFAGGGIRLRLLDDKEGYLGHVGNERGHMGNAFGNLWIDADAMFTGTGGGGVLDKGGGIRGPLYRFAFDVGLGVELSLVDGLQVGPFVRYIQIVSGYVPTLSNAHGHFFLFGASFSFAIPSGGRHDRDLDGIHDGDDACPDVPGVPSDDRARHGCPIDTDRDQIPDVADGCPTVPGVASTDPKKNGCPPDSDGDGIPDLSDACVETPGVPHADPKKNGCPKDSDEDGIPDVVDACIEVPGVASDIPRKHGCPNDRDDDEIPDVVDACPDVPGAASDNPKKHGCPPDRDADGVLDNKDACPDEPGPTNADPAKNGCPDVKVKAFVTPEKIVIRDRIYFEFNKHRLLPRSFPVLKAVADLMKKFPGIKRVSVEGHTDDVGSAAFNQGLSERRAQAVVTYLLKSGVAKDRLTSTGFGKTRPLASGDTEAAREKNRRVEFNIVDPAEFAPPDPDELQPLVP
jgi:outer membrane protein OmpA-like peptidoglycan-associated protein